MKYIETDLNDKTILITGGAGFIGSNLAFHIQEHYPHARIVIFDAFVLGHFKNLRGFMGEVISGDLSRREDLKILERFKFDYIFHQGAISDTTVQDQALVVRTNTNSLYHLLDLARAMGTKAFVYASSAGTYGNSPAPNRVGSGEEPQNVYGFSKLSMDRLAARESVGDMRLVGLRYFNVYGPREVYKGKTASMILQLGLQILASKKAKMFKWGEQKRDFVFVEDVIQANMKALEARQNGTFNVGSGEAREFNEVFGYLTKILGIEAHAEFIDNPWSFYQTHTEADITQTQEILGYQPQFNLERGIDAYIGEIKSIYEKELA